MTFLHVLMSFCLILQNLATQIIVGEESKLRYFSLCRLLSYIYITKYVCVCARARVRVRFTELKQSPFELKCQTRSVLAVISPVLKQLALATFLGQANFNQVVKIVSISVFISAFLVHLKKCKVLK